MNKLFYMFLLLCALPVHAMDDTTPGNPHLPPAYKTHYPPHTTGFVHDNGYMVLHDDDSVDAQEFDKKAPSATQYTHLEEDAFDPSQYGADHDEHFQKRREQMRQQLQVSLKTYYTARRNMLARWALKRKISNQVDQLKIMFPDQWKNELSEWLVNQPLDEAGRTLAHIAATNLDEELLKMLKGKGINILQKDESGDTAYDKAHKRFVDRSGVEVHVKEAGKQEEAAPVKKKIKKVKKKVAKKQAVASSSTASASASSPASAPQPKLSQKEQKRRVEEFQKLSKYMLAQEMAQLSLKDKK